MDSLDLVLTDGLTEGLAVVPFLRLQSLPTYPAIQEHRFKLLQTYRGSERERIEILYGFLNIHTNALGLQPKVTANEQILH